MSLLVYTMLALFFSKDNNWRFLSDILTRHFHVHPRLHTLWLITGTKSKPGLWFTIGFSLEQPMLCFMTFWPAKLVQNADMYYDYKSMNVPAHVEFPLVQVHYHNYEALGVGQSTSSEVCTAVYTKLKVYLEHKNECKSIRVSTTDLYARIWVQLYGLSTSVPAWYIYVDLGASN